MSLRSLMEKEQKTRARYKPNKYPYFSLEKMLDGTSRNKAYIVFLCDVENEAEFRRFYQFPFVLGSKFPAKCGGNPYDPDTQISCDRCREGTEPNCANGEANETTSKFGLLIYDLDEKDPSDGIKIWECSEAVLGYILSIQEDHEIEKSICAISRKPGPQKWFNVQYTSSIDNESRVTQEQYNEFEPALVGTGKPRTITVLDAYADDSEDSENDQDYDESASTRPNEQASRLPRRRGSF